VTHFIRAYCVDNNEQNGMMSPKKPIDVFCKRYVELYVSKQNGVPDYLDTQRRDMNFVKKNKESSGMWLREAVRSSDMSRNFYTTVYDVTTQLPPWELHIWRRLLRCLGTTVIHFHNTFVTKSTAALYGCC